MLDGVKRQVCGSFMAQETVFLCILTGPLPSETVSSLRTTVCYSNEAALDEQISKFFEIEDLFRRKCMSEADKYCEKHFMETTIGDS